MPLTENETTGNQVSDSPAIITAWWKKFHFSGRVIMCSVLFGLGLVLIGGLIFAINVDDETKKDENSEILNELPTKAPSGYVGPVVMGIGGFIVTVGVIMCLFETQVCRKKTGDTKPLISVKNDDSEAKGIDSTAIPSTSHNHKNHKHKCRKASSSPRKTKNKHIKSHSNEQKQASYKSPPISIDKSKSFITSSEENFLTPPNTLDEHPSLTHSNSREAEIQTSSSLMKSFTSSVPSWNQSTEFLTPTSSFKDNSVSIDNSVELNEKQGQANFKTNEMYEIECTHDEYMTPVTTEEKRIENMAIQVKNEYMKIEKSQSDKKEIDVNLSTKCVNDTNVINVANENKEVEDVKISNDLSLDDNFNTSTVKDTSDKSTEVLPDAYEKDKIVKENAFSDIHLSGNNASTEEFMSNKNETTCESPDTKIHTIVKEEDSDKDIVTSQDSTSDIKIEERNVVSSVQENIYVDGSEKLNSLISHDSLASNIDKANNVSEFDSKLENNVLADLESNASSEETLVSRDSSVEKSKCVSNAQTVLSMAEEDSKNTSKTPVVSESLKHDQHPSNLSISDHRNSLSEILKEEKDPTDNGNDMNEIKNIDENSVIKSS